MSEREERNRAVVQLLSTRIKQRRVEREWTQQDLADALRAPRTWVSDVENGGQKGIEASTIIRFAQALEVSTDYLLGLTDDPTPPSRRTTRTRKKDHGQQ